jgi:hypothetical protein
MVLLDICTRVNHMLMTTGAYPMIISPTILELIELASKI